MAMTVTATQTGAGAFNGLALTVKVVTGQASSPAGTTANSGTVTTPQQSITPAATGSFVYGVLFNNVVSTAFTAAANTTFSANVSDTTNGVAYGTFRLTATTTSGTPVTAGATAPTETTGDLNIALLEIKAGTGLAEDASSPAAVSTKTAQTVTTASFTPPSGSLLVAQVAANNTGDGTNSMAMSLSDSSGLTWVKQVAEDEPIGSATYEAASIWTAAVLPFTSSGSAGLAALAASGTVAVPFTAAGSVGLAALRAAGTTAAITVPVSFNAIPGLAEPGAFTPGQPATLIFASGSIGMAGLQMGSSSAPGSALLLAFPF